MIQKTYRLYQRDVAILKYYSVDKIKLTLCKSLRVRGFDRLQNKKATVNDEKLEENISRTRSTIQELVECNDFTHFVTLTINPEKYNRYNLKKYYKDFSQFWRDYQKKYSITAKYLFIPEMHQDGAWHLHGFIYGIPPNHFKRNKHGYLDWFPYREKFGYISIDIIKNKVAASKYITKYISKKLSECVTELNAKMYYCSQGLKRAEEIKRGTLTESVLFTYQNDYVKVLETHSIFLDTFKNIIE